MIFNLSGFSLLSFFLIILIGIMLLLIPNMTEKTVVFGVRVPPSKLELPIFATLKKQYRSYVAILIVIFGIGSLLIPPSLVLIQALLTLLFLAPFFAIYLKEHYALERAKKEGGWYDDVVTRSEAELTINGAGLQVWIYFVPGLLILAILFVAGALLYPSIPGIFATHFGANGQPNGFSTKSIWSVFGTGFVGLVVSTFLIALTYVTYRTPLSIDPSIPQSNTRLRIFRKTFVVTIGLILVGLNLVFLITSLMIWGIVAIGPYGGVVLVLAPLFAILVILTLILFRTGQLGSNLKLKGDAVEPEGPNQEDNFVRKDDDVFWKAGMIYVNKDDKRLFVPKRFGVGYTLNFGRPGSWIFIIGIIAIPVVIIVLTLALR